ncbi:MAG: hypothetical protein SPH68_02645 [Candidatus Borkfalkiaceae bacterium]|nr:hypothetical protein [Clostridia bacterium]MDY6223045.1 hypothetical protein [Christensenellaceae bacterium]
MNGKKTVKNTAIALLCASFAATAAGCDSLIKTDNETDMSRVVATVDITREKDFASGGKYESFNPVVQKVSGNIYKRDLISAFLSSGYSSVQSGATYKDTFNKLMDTLVARKITVQYSVAYFLEEESDTYSVSGYETYISAQKNELKDVEEEKRTQILTFKYFLTEGGAATAENDDYARAVYSLKKAVNDSLDSSETTFMRAESGSSNEIEGVSGDSRSVPTNINTEKSDYYNADYEIYTGYNSPDSCGGYERQERSTAYSRTAAYNQFLTNLVSNGLISGDDIKTTDFLKIDYYYVELLSQLEQAMITKFSDALNKDADASLTDEYLIDIYNEEYEYQKKTYDNDLSAFETAIGSLSESSFVLYVPAEAGKTTDGYQYGYVYNILLPFSANDTNALSAAKSDAEKANTSAEKAKRMGTYYKERARLANNIVAQDQRTSWFSNDSTANYAGQREDGKWYFFDKYVNDTTGRYEKAAHYDSAIAFDGEVKTDEKGKFTAVITPKAGSEKTVLAFIRDVLEARLGATGVSPLATYKTSPTANEKNEFEYADFMYYKNKIDVTNGTGVVDLNTYFSDTTSAQYKAVTAVNEILFAYGTDTGAINTYIGYTVTPTCDETFVKEFAYAAKEAVKDGVGTYTVCLTDYGWHIMYCNYVYDAGSVYGNADDIFCAANKDEKGEYKADTFAKYFYESLKSKIQDENSTIVQEKLLTAYNTETAVTYFTARYQDLLEMGN